MHHVEQRRVVLVDDERHLLVGLLVGTHDDAFEALVRVHLALVPSVFVLVRDELHVEIMLQPLLVEVLGTAHVEVQHWMARPVALLLAYGETLKEVLASLVVGMNHRGEQRLAEPPRTAQKHILITLIYEVGKILRLVDIQIVAFSYLLECLYSYRIFSRHCHIASCLWFFFAKLVFLFMELLEIIA